MIVIVDNAMVGEHFDFRGCACFRFYLEQLPVSLVSRGIHTVYLLYRDLLAIDNVVGFTVFCPGLGYQLEVKNIRTAIDCVLNGCTVDEILNESFFDDNHVVVYRPCTLYGHTVVQIPANGLDLTIGFNHQEVVDIFNPNFLNIIDLKLKLGFGFPCMGDFVHKSKLGFVDGIHQAVCVEVE